MNKKIENDIPEGLAIPNPKGYILKNDCDKSIINSKLSKKTEQFINNMSLEFENNNLQNMCRVRKINE